MTLNYPWPLTCILPEKTKNNKYLLIFIVRTVFLRNNLSCLYINDRLTIFYRIGIKY